MTNRLKKLSFIIITALLIAFLLGPPLSFASKLPTVCNVFHKRSVDKAGTCGHRTTLSKVQDKSFEVEVVHFANMGISTNHFTATSSRCPTCLPEIADLLQSNPLRC
jgi:hypothetical protein